jgi:hypothetical protein
VIPTICRSGQPFPVADAPILQCLYELETFARLPRVRRRLLVAERQLSEVLSHIANATIERITAARRAAAQPSFVDLLVSQDNSYRVATANAAFDGKIEALRNELSSRYIEIHTRPRIRWDVRNFGSRPPRL